MLRRDAHGGGELHAAVREAHGGGIAAIDTGVTLVQRELQRLGARPAGAELGLEVGYERVGITTAVDM
ncbi:MAG TPA: hypothetical protein VEM59_04675 [Acidimicrobiia bacterium]|nr:hypothetical protein [Acidimicrobiia bacterium]